MKFLRIFLLLCVILLCLSCTQTNITRSEFVLGTNCTISLLENGNSRVVKDVFARLREIDNLMSVNLPASDISRINAAAGTEAVKVNKDVFKLIEKSLYFPEISGGSFDLTIGPIINLWGFNNKPRIPLQEEIDIILPLVNRSKLFINSDSLTVFLKKEGMAIDLGAIAKGYAADEAAEIIINAGVKRAIIDLGGNIIVVGENKNNRPWRVGIQDPNRERGNYIGIVQIPAEGLYTSIVTSGVYERYFIENGKRYHHIFSPFTGYPIDNELLSVTIISPNSMYADALSTAVFVLGYEKGLELINSIPETGAVFVFNDGSVRFTDGVIFN
ncbi:MAG: FAD:protein FMN transferase [Treponema sp.]|jgi:thiamine biosynthesis lipoprotein|nr:FAD:protein FMN transferase [Treponema sp.]